MLEPTPDAASASAPILLQLSSWPRPAKSELAGRAPVVCWFELDDQDAWLAEHAASVAIIVSTGDVGVPSELMRALPNLKLIALNAVGYDKVDVNLARERGVRVTNTPDVLTDDVADLAIALFLALFCDLPAVNHVVRTGAWPETKVPLARTTSGRRCGILGLGRIGSAIARRLEAFGADIAYTARSPKPVAYQFHPTPLALARDVEVLFVASSAELNRAPLVDRAVIEALGPQGALVNIGRGSLVDEAELASALHEGRLWGAALDVFAHEPHVPEALRTAPNVVLTPHVASATVETRGAMAGLVLANIDAFLAGRPLITPVV